MSNFGNAALYGLGHGLGQLTNIAFGGLTSYSMRNSGIQPFDTLYMNLDSPSGFSSWAHPSYATPFNVNAAASGFDTTFAPLYSSFSTPFLGGGLFGGGFGGGLSSGLFGSGLGGGLFGFGYNSFPTSNTFIEMKTDTHLGTMTNFRGWF